MSLCDKTIVSLVLPWIDKCIELLLPSLSSIVLKNLLLEL